MSADLIAEPTDICTEDSGDIIKDFFCAELLQKSADIVVEIQNGGYRL